MSITLTHEEALEQYLVINGPSKASVIAAGIHVSESTARQILGRAMTEGRVKKDGTLFSWVAKKKTKKAAKAEEAAGVERRAQVTARDQLVLHYMQKHASKDGESVSRETIREDLAKHGHDLSGSLVYLSLFRLCNIGEIERVHVGKRAPEWRMAYHRD